MTDKLRRDADGFIDLDQFPESDVDALSHRRLRRRFRELDRLPAALEPVGANDRPNIRSWQAASVAVLLLVVAGVMFTAFQIDRDATTVAVADLGNGDDPPVVTATTARTSTTRSGRGRPLDDTSATTAPTTLATQPTDQTTAEPTPRAAPSTTVLSGPVPTTAVVEVSPSSSTAPDGVLLPPSAEMDLAERYATTLADGDWEAAKLLNPLIRTKPDTFFEAGYSELVASTLLGIRAESLTDETTRLRLGLIAHEQDGSGPFTNVFCVSWDVSLTAQTVIETGGIATGVPSERVVDRDVGWVDPVSFAQLLLQHC